MTTEPDPTTAQDTALGQDAMFRQDAMTTQDLALGRGVRIEPDLGPAGGGGSALKTGGVYRSDEGGRAVIGRYRQMLDQWPRATFDVLTDTGHLVLGRTLRILDLLRTPERA